MDSGSITIDYKYNNYKSYKLKFNKYLIIIHYNLACKQRPTFFAKGRAGNATPL